MEIKYYEMSEADIPRVSEMELEFFGKPWKEESIAHYMEQEMALFISAKDRTRLCGYIAVISILDEADIVSVAVDSGYRRMGIARELLDISYERLFKEGVRKLNLEVRESNAAAIALYESEGFEKCGRRKNFYSNPEEDAILYTRWLKEA